MKKLLILAAAFLFSFQIVNAQTEKGTQNLGVNLQFYYTNSKNFSINTYDGSSANYNNKATSIALGPNYSYFIADKLDLGAVLEFSSITNKYDQPSPGETGQSSRSYSAELFLRKYVMFTDKIGLRTGPYVDYGRGTFKQTYSGNEALSDVKGTSNTYSAGGRLEMVYYPSKHLGVAAYIASVDYYHENVKTNSQGHSSDDQVDFNFINNGLSLSVFYAFGGK